MPKFANQPPQIRVPDSSQCSTFLSRWPERTCVCIRDCIHCSFAISRPCMATPRTISTAATRERRDAVAAYCVLLGVIAVTHTWVNARQPAAYMDELYHVPQAASFCAGNTTYSRHITTPPAPYLFSALLSRLTGCSVRPLRLHSALAAFTTLPLLARITKSHRLALVVATHPPLLFFSALYYTDTFGLVAILACWALALRQRHVYAATVAIIAAACRQTYAVWHALIAALSLLSAIRHGTAILPVVLPHATVGLLYVALFVYNGFQVAIGDQANHAVALHAAQLCYYVAYCAAFAAPLFTRFFRVPKLIPLMLSLALAVIAVAHTGDRTHPFVLADNRHFVFYLYRKILLRGAWTRFAIAPLYALAALLPFEFDARKSTPLWRCSESMWYNVKQAAVLATVAVTVVLSPLLEPRYFIPGFVMAIALFLQRHRQACTWRVCGAMVAFNLLLHFGLVFVFAERPFARPPDAHMPTDLSPGRFML